MSEDRKKGGIFGDEDLDEEVATADDTGLVSGQQEIAKELMFEAENGPPKEP